MRAHVAWLGILLLGGCAVPGWQMRALECAERDLKAEAGEGPLAADPRRWDQILDCSPGHPGSKGPTCEDLLRLANVGSRAETRAALIAAPLVEESCPAFLTRIADAWATLTARDLVRLQEYISRLPDEEVTCGRLALGSFLDGSLEGGPVFLGAAIVKRSVSEDVVAALVRLARRDEMGTRLAIAIAGTRSMEFRLQLEDRLRSEGVTR